MRLQSGARSQWSCLWICCIACTCGVIVRACLRIDWVVSWKPRLPMEAGLLLCYPVWRRGCFSSVLCHWKRVGSLELEEYSILALVVSQAAVSCRWSRIRRSRSIPCAPSGCPGRASAWRCRCWRGRSSSRGFAFAEDCLLGACWALICLVGSSASTYTYWSPS